MIVGVFIVLITLLLYFVLLFFEQTATFAIAIALPVSILMSWGAYYNSDKLIIAVTKARPATMEENKRVIQILESLMLSSGLTHTPKLYIIDDPQPNAFATGRNPQNAVVGLTTGLLNTLDHYELEAVIAHELAHIRNYDIRLSAILTVMVGFIVMLSDIFVRSFIWGSTGNRSNNNNSRQRRRHSYGSRYHMPNTLTNTSKNNANGCFKTQRILSRCYRSRNNT